MNGAAVVYSIGNGITLYAQYGNEMLTLKLEDGCCTYFSNSFFRSASVLRLSMWICMSGRRRVQRRTRERGGKEEENKGGGGREQEREGERRRRMREEENERERERRRRTREGGKEEENESEGKRKRERGRQGKGEEGGTQ